MEDLDLENFMGHFRKNHEQDNKPVNQYINSRVSKKRTFTKRPTITLWTKWQYNKLHSKFTETSTKKILSVERFFRSKKYLNSDTHATQLVTKIKRSV